MNEETLFLRKDLIKSFFAETDAELIRKKWKRSFWIIGIASTLYSLGGSESLADVQLNALWAVATFILLYFLYNKFSVKEKGTKLIWLPTNEPISDATDLI